MLTAQQGKCGKWFLGTGLILGMYGFLQAPVMAISGLAEIESGALEQPQPRVMQVSSEIPPEHWSYKLMERLMPMAKIDTQAEGVQLDGMHALSRTGMTVLIADFAEAVKKNDIEDQLTERDKAQFEVLQEEFQSELKVLQARIAKVEHTVQYLSDKVEKTARQEGETVRVGRLGTVQLYGQLHAWATASLEDDAPDRNIRLRRINLGLKGKLAEQWQYNVMFDPARSENILKDYWLEYSAVPHHSIRIGQFRPGNTYDASLRSSSRNYTAERTLIGRLANTREPGVAVFGQWKYLDYQVGAYNGNGENTRDDNNKLAVAGRVTVRPLAGIMDEKKWGRVELGGSVFDGHTGPNHMTENRDRYGVEARYHHPKFEVNSEYLAFNNSNSIKGDGWYVEGVYKMTPKLNFVARYDTLDPNRKVGTNTQTEYIAGLNYLWESYHIRLGLFYQYLKDQAAPGTSGSAVRLMVQHTF
jgi:hypothetical protein